MKILYHANCNDGAGAALAAWMHLGDDECEYIPVQYGGKPPDVSDEDVMILDFSYKRETLLTMATVAKTITVIDHHKTAQEDLSEPFPDRFDYAPVCDIRVIFDMEKSGAVLTWEYFSDEPVPRLLQIIQDRDLWRFEFDETRDVTTALQLQVDWKDWYRFIDQPDLIRTLVVRGAAINQYLHLRINEIIESIDSLAPWTVTGDVVPVLNLPGFMFSDALHMALKRYPEAPYAVAWFELPYENKRVYSLRSRKGSDIDVSEIAKRNGGGGHKHAAGFVVKL
jgi:uncharacterized protein